MFIKKSFHGDLNEDLMVVQEEYFESLAGFFYICAKERYEAAIKLVGVKTHLYSMIRKRELSNIGLFEEPYKIVAAYYRFQQTYDTRMMVNFNEDDYIEILGNRWKTFFYKQLKDLVQFDYFTITILELVVNYIYRDNNSFDKLIEIINDYFGNDFISACNDYTDKN